MLYQLSYSRNVIRLKCRYRKTWICFIEWGKQDSNLRRRTPADLQSAPVGHFGISPKLINKELNRAECQIRTDDPEITNHVLWPTELIRQVGKLPASHRYDHLPLLSSDPGGVRQELIVQDLPAAKVGKNRFVPNKKKLHPAFFNALYTLF